MRTSLQVFTPSLDIGVYIFPMSRMLHLRLDYFFARLSRMQDGELRSRDNDPYGCCTEGILNELRRSEDLHGSSYELVEDESGVFELFLKPEAAPQDRSFPNVYMDIRDFCTL
jgi:hypothetical protein